MSATLTASIASLILNIDRPMESDQVTPRDDLIGVKVWAETTSASFTPSETNLVFDGNSLSVTIPNLSFGTTYWVKYALISDIEPENYVISSALSGVPLESTYQEDATPAPTPTGVTFTPAFSTIIVEHDAPTYTAGHGHSRSVLFGKIYTDGALPTFSQSTSIAEFTGRIHSFATTMGTTWRLWLVWVSNDGVASSVPYGGTNGIEVTTGKIGTTDLGPLIVEAGNLANGTVTASKLAAESITATKFANDIEPVSVVSSIPTSKSTSTVFNTADGKLYRWNGTSYVASIPSSDISGQLADTQIEALSASKVTGQLSDTQLSAISAAKLTGTIVGTQITDGAISTEKLSAGAVTAAKIAADTITADNIAAGAITATELAAGAVVAGKIAAGTIQAGDIAAGTITGDKIAANTITSSQIAADTITAGNIAAGAIGASEIAAGAITAKHITITDYENLCFNGRGESLEGWYGGGMTSSASFPYWPSSVGASSAFNFSTRDNYFGPNIPVKSGDSFFVSFDSIPFGGGTANYSFNIGLRFFSKDGNTITWAAGASRAASESGTQSSSGSVTAPENSAYAVIWVQIDKDGNNTSTASGDGFHATNIRVQRKNAGSLIVDGAITASKIAANAIAVGTAAIENGAIVNAMIANAAIDNAKIANLAVDNAKIANLNASKITAGTISADRIAANSLTSDKIDTRGLSIKDSAGNVILAAGSGTAWSKNPNIVRSLKTWSIASTAALVTNSTNSQDGNLLKINADAGYWISRSPKMDLQTNGSKYTVSFRAYYGGITNTAYSVGFRINELASTTTRWVFIYSGWNNYSFVIDSADTAMSDCSLDIWTGGNPYFLYIGDLKVEAGESATPWVPNIMDNLSIDNKITSSNASTYIDSLSVSSIYLTSNELLIKNYTTELTDNVYLLATSESLILGEIVFDAKQLIKSLTITPRFYSGSTGTGVRRLVADLYMYDYSSTTGVWTRKSTAFQTLEFYLYQKIGSYSVDNLLYSPTFTHNISASWPTSNNTVVGYRVMARISIVHPKSDGITTIGNRAITGYASI